MPASRFPLGIYGWALAAILLFTAAPLISVFAADAIAGANDCALNEGTVNSCMIFGADWGDTLYAMFVLGWLMLVTLPLGAGAFIVLVVILVIHHLAWQKAQDRTQP